MGLQALEQVREKLCSNLDNDIEVQDKVRKGEMKKVSFVYRLVFFIPTYLYFVKCIFYASGVSRHPHPTVGSDSQSEQDLEESIVWLQESHCSCNRRLFL